MVCSIKLKKEGSLPCRKLPSTAVFNQFYHSVGLIEQTVENTDSLAEGRWHISQGGNPSDKDTFFKGESSHLSVFEGLSVSMETKQGGDREQLEGIWQTRITMTHLSHCGCSQEHITQYQHVHSPHTGTGHQSQAASSGSAHYRMFTTATHYRKSSTW